MRWGSTRTGAMALELTERPNVPAARQTRFVSRLLHPLINFSPTISSAPQDPQRGFSVLPHLTYAVDNIRCRRWRSLNSIVAFRDPILPSSYGLILSECGGNQYLHRRRRGPFYERLPYGKQQPSPRSDENGGGEFPRHKRPSAPAWYPPPVT
jgi:hypothetical protein